MSTATTPPVITLTDEYMKRHAAMSVPGAYWDASERAYVLRSPTPRAAAVALRLFPALASTHPELIDLRATMGQEVRPFDNATKLNQPITAARVRAALRDEGNDLYQFQAIDAGYMCAVLGTHGGAYMGHERGLGKTVSTCAIIDELDCRRVLVVAPNTAKWSVWGSELERLCPWLETVVLRNTKAQRDRDLGYVRQLIEVGQPVCLVVHYEALRIIGNLRAGNRGWDQFGEWDLVVADEAHRIWNPKAQMTKALKRVPAARKLALSGSIIQNRAEELFSPLQWLFPKHYRSRWRDWNDRYLDYIDSGYSRVCVGVRVERLADLRNELGVFMCYRRKSDELDLLARTEETRYVALSHAQRVAYTELQESCLAQLSSGELVKAQDGLVLLTRLRQVATGLDLVSGELTDSSKLDLAVELITDNADEAFVAFSWYRAAAYALAKRLDGLGVGNYVVTGETKPSDRAKYIQEFQAGAGRVFIGTLSTLGESVTLHRASNAIFLDRSWNPGNNAQAADRIYRIGQEKPVTITHIVAKDTVDELRVQPVLADKDALRKMILGGN